MKNSTAPVLIGLSQNCERVPIERSCPNLRRSSSYQTQDQWNSSVNPEDLAICVQNVYKSYEDGKPILNNSSMHVKKGTIYSLLGASGCGKSTLLETIVGLKKWDSGNIFLFNKRVNGVAGCSVGYMPQEIALYDQLSVEETLMYYGQLYGLPNKETLLCEVEWLMDFLQLPSKFKLIKDLSGGMKRRCSLAITMVHRPQLLILDEPTVGLDPLLREGIWEHLLKIVQTRKQTVVITTHYIEETRCSNTIGVMRKGRLIAQDSPELLLRHYNCQLLEEVVLALCHTDELVPEHSNDSGFNNNIKGIVVVSEGNEHVENSGWKTVSPKNSYNKLKNIQPKDVNVTGTQLTDYQNVSQFSSTAFARIQAFSKVIWLIFMRHPAFMVMVLFLPAIQILLTLAVIGTLPKDLKFGVVNNDLPYYSACFGDNLNYIEKDLQQSQNTFIAVKQNVTTCDFKRLSCRLVTELSKSDTLTLIPTRSAEQAYDMVKQGELWGYFSFPANYSQHLENLIVEQKFAKNDTLEGSRVSMRMDMSHYLGATIAIRDGYDAYQRFVRNLAISCGIDPREFTLPLLYQKPVFGSNNMSFQAYVIPIIVLSVIFEIPMLVTAIIFINDRKQGTLDSAMKKEKPNNGFVDALLRARVAGLRFKEMLISHFLTEGSVIIGQGIICSVVMIFTYDFSIAGSYSLYFLIIFLSGLCGESLGLLLGVIFTEEVEAVLFGILLGPLLYLYNGTLWPVEGMTSIVQAIALYLTPTTLAIDAIRSVIYKGFGFFHRQVWPGLAMISVWTVAFWVVSIMIFVRKTR